MLEELTKKSEEISKKIDKINKFSSKHDFYPYKETNKIIEELTKLTDSIPDIAIPTNQNELLLSEIKRRARAGAIDLEYHLNEKSYDFNTIISITGIPHSDIEKLPIWLKNNKKETLESIEHLFQTTDPQGFESFLEYDILNIKEQLEKSAKIDIQKYHETLGKLLQEKTKAGESLKYIKGVPTHNERSYFNQFTNTIAISIHAIYYSTENGILQLKEKELIKLYGHEGMGHALNHIITNSNNLPDLQKRGLSSSTLATRESLAKFYENIIFEDLKNSPETQKELGISNIFNKIYEEAKDIRKLQEYKSKLFHYTISLMADESLGALDDPEVARKKMELIFGVALNPSVPLNFITKKIPIFDSEGNLTMETINQIIYAAQPVERALEEFRKRGIFYDEKGRSKIDEVFLNGYWTPTGFVDNARLKAQE